MLWVILEYAPKRLSGFPVLDQLNNSMILISKVVLCTAIDFYQAVVLTTNNGVINGVSYAATPPKVTVIDDHIPGH